MRAVGSGDGEAVSRKAVATRRQRNRELAERDAANRCGFCRRALPRLGVKMRWHDPKLYCSDDCLQTANELDGLATREPGSDDE